MLTPSFGGAVETAAVQKSAKGAKGPSQPENRVEPRSRADHAGNGETEATSVKRANGADAADVADNASAAEDSPEASFSSLLAWLSGALPPETGLPVDPARKTSGSTNVLLEKAVGQGQSLPAGGNILPLLPPEGLAPPAGDSAVEVFGDIQAELARRAPVTPIAVSALLGQASDAGSTTTPGNAGTVDLSFLASSVSQSVSTQVSGEGARSLPGSGSAGANSGATLLGQPQLENAMGQRVVWMVQQGVHDARVRVHPEHLGPIEIRLKLDGDSAQVTFHSPHSAVRDALSDAVPRLREMMGDAGLSLSHVDVDTGGYQPSQREHGDAVDRETGEGAGVEAEILEPGARRVAIARGLVDTFA